MLKVGVIFGGKSIEREVSFSSGRTVCDHLDPQLYTVIPIFQSAQGVLYILPQSFLYRGKIADFEHRLDTQATKIVWDDLPALIDFMYIAMHGTYAEDGRLQAVLELFKIPYLGSKVFGSSVGMNKAIQNIFLKRHGIKTPRGFTLTVQQVQQSDQNMLQQFMQQAAIDFPVVIKPQAEGSSIGVFVAHDMNQLLSKIQRSCFITNTLGQDIMVEEKLMGMEFNCIVITDVITGKLKALPPTEVMLQEGKEIFDYHHKYMPGAANKRTPAQCSEQDLQKIQDVCVATMKALEFSNIGRIDGFLTSQGDVVILDSNPISGMAPSSFVFRQAAEIGMGHGDLINHLIKTELQHYRLERDVKTMEYKQRMRVAVLMGGPSNEREVSLDSGRNVCYKLSKEKYEVIPVFVDSDLRLYQINQQLLVSTSTREMQRLLKPEMAFKWSDLPAKVDFVFIALHGAPGENGIMQGTLEMLGMPYNGPSVFASSLCMDKYKTGQFLQAHGFDVPQSYLLSKKDYQSGNLQALQEFLQKFSHSYVVKPHDDGCSVMVSAPKNEQDLQAVLATMFAQKEFALFEERIIGTELTVGVLGNKNPRALVPSEAIARNGLLSAEEKFLPGAGENQTPARIDSVDLVFVQKIIEEAYRAIGCMGYSRVDCFLQTADQSPTGHKRVVILEFNTLPALTPATCLFHQAAEVGLSPMQLIDEIVQLGLQAHQKSEIVSVDHVLAVHEQG
ncbi:ATP-grasp domain-containing protein [Candidatus Babeliales bacterium]|nr:ATP-grasp domain-containing protein [Candidatus Babeliales bacterium]